jgi:hypothetical protein
MEFESSNISRISARPGDADAVIDLRINMEMVVAGVARSEHSDFVKWLIR